LFIDRVRILRAFGRLGSLWRPVIRRAAGRERRNSMEPRYLLAGALAVGLLIYLAIVLVKPEIFS
jgi:F subunit of K+-transporting ATPase (Potass_KdpF)